MINFNVQNFKCFYDVSVNINGLTVLAGSNGFGKSSIVQALLFMRRTIEHCAKWDNMTYTKDFDFGLNVELNGAYCLALGTSKNIIPIEAPQNSELKLELCEGNNKFWLSYRLNDDFTELWLTPISENTGCSGEYSKLPIFLKEFYYLNAERLGPRVSQPIKFHDYPNVGWQGEYCAQILSDYGSMKNFEVEQERFFNSDSENLNKGLLRQTQMWMNYLMPGVLIDSRKDDKMLSAQIIVENSYTKGELVIATNIGFGISYVLPIIITGLIARKGAIMIIENPEAHLHPSAQSRIGIFLSVIANSGVRVIVETHSDHVLNGIQIAAAKGKISSEFISVNYFSERKADSELPQPNIEEISVTKKGELSSWPKGFFDQTQIDFAELFRLRRNE